MRYLTVFMAILFVFYCERSEELKVQKTDERITAFTLNEAHGDLLQWELQGESAFYRRDTIIVYCFLLKFYNNDGIVKSTLRADSGYVFEKTNDLKALGNVVVESNNSTTLWTEELNWIEKKQKIQTDSTIKYKKGNKIYSGIGMESDPDLKRIIIKKKFHGEGEFE